MFFLTLGRKNELVDYVKIGWEIKCEGEYFPHKVVKMAKGKKFVDDRVLKWKMIAFWKRATKDKRKKKDKKGLFLKLCSIILSTLLFQKH